MRDYGYICRCGKRFRKPLILKKMFNKIGEFKVCPYCRSPYIVKSLDKNKLWNCILVKL